MHCPSCATPVDVDQRHALLVVCSSCRSAFVVDGEAAALHGEMAVLAHPSGPLAVGNAGELHGRRFRVLGRVRYGYPLGLWDEWYLVDEEGAAFWISDDERELTVSAARGVEDGLDWNAFEAGASVDVAGQVWHVDECGIAVCEGGEGQLPFVVTPGEETPFVDLGRLDGVATLEWSDGDVRCFVGTRIPVTALRMDYESDAPDTLEGERPAGPGGRRRVMRSSGREVALNCESCGATPAAPPEEGATSMRCEYCGRDIDLSLDRIPCGACGAGMAVHSVDAAAMVCNACGAQHDLAGDGAHVVAKLTREHPKSPISIGMRGEFRGREWRIVGHIRSYERDEGVKYHCDSFCAFNDEEGYGWFELEEGHVSFNHPTAARPVGFDPRSARRKQRFTVHGTQWRVFERGTLTIEYVGGELSWVARVGDVTGYMDAVAPPFMLCAEWPIRHAASAGGGAEADAAAGKASSEMEWSRSEWIAPEEFCAAFRLPRGAVRGRGVAPHQPYSHPEGDRALVSIGLAVVAVNLLFILWCFAAGRGDDVGRFDLAPGDYAAEYFTPEFDIASPGLCRATFEAPVDNSWVYLDCALVDARGRAVLEFSAECSYYHGVEGGERWSEGSRSDDVDFRVQDPGTYRLLVKGQAGMGNAEGGWAGPRVAVRVKEGVMQARWATVVLVVGGLLLIVAAVRRGRFESRRWDDD